jgi:hypothetical protein
MAESTQCIDCSRYEGLNTCEAYPDGIPVEIITGEHDHTEPFPGDNGIRFEAIQDVAEDTN